MINPRTGRETMLVRRRLMTDILAERLVWQGPDLVMARWERRGDKTSRGWLDMTRHTPVLNTTTITRLDTRRLGTREAK